MEKQNLGKASFETKGLLANDSAESGLNKTRHQRMQTMHKRMQQWREEQMIVKNLHKILNQ